MRVSSPSDSATPSGVTGVAASADASEAPTGVTGVPASADASEAPTDGDVYVGLSHANNASDGRDDAAMFLVHDSSTSAHLVNDAALFIDGSQESCYVRVYGVNSNESSPLIARTRGDVKYHLGDGFCSVLGGCLAVPDANICGRGKKAVLVSTKLLALSGVGTHFKAGGREVEFISDGNVVGRFERRDEIYVDSYKNKPIARVEKALRALRERRGEQAIVRVEKALQALEERKGEQALVRVERALNALQGQDENRSGDEVRSAPAADSIDRVKSDSSEGGSESAPSSPDTNRNSKGKTGDKPVKPGKKGKTGDKPVKPNEKATSKGARLSKKDRSVLIRKLHARIHFGKTHHIVRALSEAYDVDVREVSDLPCDACAWAKAKHRPVGKEQTRPARRVGERLHYDLFKAPCRSENGSKWLLVVVDEFSGCVWCFGLKRKSETLRTVQTLVAAVERLLGKRVDGLVRQGDKSFLALPICALTMRERTFRMR